MPLQRLHYDEKRTDMTHPIDSKYHSKEENKKIAYELSRHEETQSNYPSHQIAEKTTNKGLPQDWTRVTFILRKEYAEKLKEISYWDRTTVKKIMDEALFHYLENKTIQIFKK